MVNLGSIGASHDSVQYVEPRRRDPFGGLSEGLSALGKGLEEASNVNQDMLDAQAMMDKARADKKKSLDRAQALILWNRTQGEIALGQAELGKNFDPAGKDYLEQADKIAEDKYAYFRSNINPELLPDFDPDIEQHRQRTHLSSYQVENTIEGANWQAGLAELQTQAMDAILMGEGTADDWGKKLQTYFDTSPLSKLETQALAKTVNDSLVALDFTTQSKDELLHWQAYDDADPKTGLPAGMPGPVTGLLSIIMQVESGGKWDVIQGGATFTDFKDHPNKTYDKSSAAGGYQFIYRTWKTAQAALGLSDFSPKNQAKAALWLAENDYRARTGRDLNIDLSSGDPIVIENIRKVLGGTGDKNVTWAGLQNVSPEAFYKAVTGTAGTMPGSMNDPAYASMSWSDKLKGLEFGQKAAQDAAKAAVDQFQAQQTRFINGMKQQIDAGLRDVASIQEDASKNSLTQDQTQELLTYREKVRSDDVNMEKFDKARLNPNAVYGEDEKKGFGLVYAKDAREDLLAGDSTKTESLLPTIANSNYVPAQLKMDLAGMLASPKPEIVTTALRTLSNIRTQAPAAFEATFDDQIISDTIRFNQDSEFKTDAELVNELQARRNPANKQTFDVVETNVRNYIQTQPELFLPATIAAQAGLKFEEADFSSLAALGAEAQRYFKSEYMRTGDLAGAYKVAIGRVQATWGVSEIGGRPAKLMKNPPEKAGAVPLGGSYNWIDPTIRRDLSLSPDAKFDLTSDHITAYEKAHGQPPSYMVSVEKDGVLVPEMDPVTGYPRRVQLTADSEIRTAQMDSELWARRTQHVYTESVRLETDMLLGPVDEYTKKSALLMGWARDHYQNNMPKDAKTFVPDIAEIPRADMNEFTRGGIPAEEMAEVMKTLKIKSEDELLDLLQNVSGKELADLLDPEAYDVRNTGTNFVSIEGVTLQQYRAMDYQQRVDAGLPYNTVVGNFLFAKYGY